MHVLVRFRLHAFACTADIKAMYYQVVIPEHQRDALRFLWVDDRGELVQDRMTRHLFGGGWCASSATFALRKAGDRAEPAISNVVDSAFYVDDFLLFAASPQEMTELVLKTKEALAQSGFNLTKFASNAEELLSSLPSEAKSAVDPTSSSGVLGLKWCPMIVLCSSVIFHSSFLK